MFTISSKKARRTASTAQEALDLLNPSGRELLYVEEVVEDPKMPGLVMHLWGMKAVRGTRRYIQSLIDAGAL